MQAGLEAAADDNRHGGGDSRKAGKARARVALAGACLYTAEDASHKSFSWFVTVTADLWGVVAGQGMWGRGSGRVRMYLSSMTHTPEVRAPRIESHAAGHQPAPLRK